MRLITTLPKTLNLSYILDYCRVQNVSYDNMGLSLCVYPFEIKVRDFTNDNATTCIMFYIRKQSGNIATYEREAIAVVSTTVNITGETIATPYLVSTFDARYPLKVSEIAKIYSSVKHNGTIYNAKCEIEVAKNTHFQPLTKEYFLSLCSSYVYRMATKGKLKVPKWGLLMSLDCDTVEYKKEIDNLIQFRDIVNGDDIDIRGVENGDYSNYMQYRAIKAYVLYSVGNVIDFSKMVKEGQTLVKEKKSKQLTLKI